jgi:hypothetical protein
MENNEIQPIQPEQGAAPVNLIVVRQLPIIEEHLRSIRPGIEKKVQQAMALAVSPETIAEVKRVRAELNKELEGYEKQRKQVKEAVEAPYEKFKETYDECVSGLFQQADEVLKGKIADVENGIKKACENTLRTYFAELCEAHHLDFLRYEQAGVRVDLTSAKAKTPTKLRAQIQQFVEGVSQSVATISGMDNAAEIMVEYKQTLNLAKSVQTVQDRHAAVEAMKAAQEQMKQMKQDEGKRVERVQSYATPVAAPVPVQAPQARPAKDPNEVLRLTFTVTGPRSKLVLLKQFLDQNGYNYQ